MRFLLLLLWLIAALVPALEQPALVPALDYRLSPKGFPDGAIFTFYFYHKGDDNTPETVFINFYENCSTKNQDLDDINARLWIVRSQETPVHSNTLISWKWQEPDRHATSLEQMPPSKGWWRVDVIRHDRKHLNVFFQGFWLGMREFKLSLDNVRCIKFASDYVDLKTVQFTWKFANNNLHPLSVAEFADIVRDDPKLHFRPDFQLISFPSFPIGAHIKMTVMLRAFGLAKNSVPALLFGSVRFRKTNPTYFFMSIYQIWEEDNEELYISQYIVPKSGTLCNKGKPSGDLQHLDLTRISQNDIRMRVSYKSAGKDEPIDCEFAVPLFVAGEMDEPFEIVSHSGALIFHLEHSIPGSVAMKKE